MLHDVMGHIYCIDHHIREGDYFLERWFPVSVS